jgi:hypothetical protein
MTTLIVVVPSWSPRRKPGFPPPRHEPIVIGKFGVAEKWVPAFAGTGERLEV